MTFILSNVLTAQSNKCVITPACRLKGVLHEALNAYFKVLDSYTLADFVENNDGLSSDSFQVTAVQNTSVDKNITLQDNPL